MQEERDGIKEGNIAIAKFMGWKPFDSKEGMPGLVDSVGNTVMLGVYSPNEDWNELMPVVKKIAGLPLLDFPKKKPIMNALLSVDIEELWLAIVDFLKWFNQQPR